MMPVMSGWDFLATLRKTPSWRSIPVVVLCGMAAEQRGKLQVDDAFEKPTDLSKLVERIAELCGV
jgi:CheY-like chemotaxis protein